MVKANKKREKTDIPKIDLNLVKEKIKQNGHLFSIQKKENRPKLPSFASKSKLPSQPPSTPPKKSESSIPAGKTKTDEEKSPDKKINADKAAVSAGKSSSEQHVEDLNQVLESNFSVSFEPTKDGSPLIKERKEEPVRNMEQFLETVPSPRKKEKEEDKDNLYKSVDDSYLRSYESNYSGRRWDEDAVANDIKENLQRFDHPGHFREVRLIQDQGLRKDRFSEAAKYDLEIIDRAENERDIFRPTFERKYKTRGKL